MSQLLKVIGAAAIVAGVMVGGCSSKSKDAAKPAATTQAAANKASLFNRLGGMNAIKAVVHDFVGRAAADPKVNFTRANMAGVTPWAASPEHVAHLEAMLVDFICGATGGPCKYTGKDMATAHKGMKITDEEFGAIAADLKLSLDKFKVPVPEQTELLAIVGGTRADIVGK